MIWSGSSHKRVEATSVQRKFGTKVHRDDVRLTIQPAEECPGAVHTLSWLQRRRSDPVRTIRATTQTRRAQSARTPVRPAETTAHIGVRNRYSDWEHRVARTTYSPRATSHLRQLLTLPPKVDRRSSTSDYHQRAIHRCAQSQSSRTRRFRAPPYQSADLEVGADCFAHDV